MRSALGIRLRNKVAEYYRWERNKAANAERGRNRDRDRDRRRSRSARCSAARGSKGSGKQKKGESGVSAGPIGAALPASSSSRPTTDDTAIVRVENRRSQSVRVQLDELQTLEGCLGRAIDSQKRIIESLNFFSRMIQDEKHVFTEARKVLNELIFKAKLGRTIV